MKNLNSFVHNDNRNYNYSGIEKEEREEYNYIVELIPENSKVIDLGCGSGSLLQKLIEKKNVAGCGVELVQSGVDVCVAKGLNVRQGAVDAHLDFGEDEFDYSVCNVTIQMVRYPEILLTEMKRISKYQIISFPNFGFYKNRFDMLLKGRMPKPMMFGYKWYGTGHLHQLSIKDFYELVEDVCGLKIIRHDFVKTSNPVKDYLMKMFPNLFQSLPIFLLEKTTGN